MNNNALQVREHPGQVVESQPTSDVTIQPRVDILETEEEFQLLADFAGVRPEDVDVRFEKGELILHGRRTDTQTDRKRLIWEYQATHYHRAFRLNENIAADKIHADLKDGVLTVHLPKVETAKPRKITVKGG